MPRMGLRIGVLADSEAEAERARVLLCAALGLVPLGPVLPPVGRPGTWLARAVDSDQGAEAH